MDWSYKNERNWKNKYPQCVNNKQSPINIDTNNFDGQKNRCDLLCKLGINYKPSKCHITIENDTPTVYFDYGSYIKFNGYSGNSDLNYKFGKEGLFQLKKMTIHTPSMHTINGANYDMEVMLYHYLPTDLVSSKTDTTKKSSVNDDRGVILSLFFRGGIDSGKPNEFFSQFINRFPKEQQEGAREIDIPVNDDWTPNMLLPKNKAFFTYEGSLPHPPCNQTWYYVVFEEAGIISKHLLEGFKIAFNRNKRLTQRLNNRPVNYNNNPRFDKENERLIIEIEEDINRLREEKKQLLKSLPYEVPHYLLRKDEREYLSPSNNNNSSSSNSNNYDTSSHSNNTKFKKEEWYIKNKKSIKYLMLFIVFLLIIMLAYFSSQYIIVSGIIPRFNVSGSASSSKTSSNNNTSPKPPPKSSSNSNNSNNDNNN